MQVEQRKWSKSTDWEVLSDHKLSNKANLVFVFGSTELVQDVNKFDEIRAMYPNAEIVVSSGSGEIMADETSTDTLCVTAIYFEQTKIKTLEIKLDDVKDSFDVGAHISAHIDKDDLSNLMIFSNGDQINGSHLLTGLQFNLSETVPITGGLAGSYDPFSATYTGLNGIGVKGSVIGVGFYGNKLKIGHSSRAGWTPFGPERFITRSTNNVLFELNDEPVFDFYKKYLEGLFDDMQEAIRIYPLGIKTENGQDRLLRAFLNYDPKTGGALFAGDMPEGAKVRMMKSNVNSLIDAAGDAANSSTTPFDFEEPDLALCVSCVGRQFVLQDWIGEEIQSVNEIFKSKVPIAGFYSYGEIAPQAPRKKSALHNHTMTITTFKEI